MGETTARGYGITHQRLRASLAPLVATGQVVCWRCKEPIPAGAEWHLGHDDTNRSIYRGPEHVKCNLRAAGQRKGRKPPRRQSRKW